jgi:hypothetical protein
MWRIRWVGGGVLPRHPKNQVWGEVLKNSDAWVRSCGYVNIFFVDWVFVLEQLCCRVRPARTLLLTSGTMQRKWFLGRRWRYRLSPSSVFLVIFTFQYIQLQSQPLHCWVKSAYLLATRIGCGSALPFGIHSVVLEEIRLVPPQRPGPGRMAQIRWPWLREEVCQSPSFMFTSSLHAYVLIYLLEPTSFWIGIAVKAHFEFMEKLGVDKWCFHDRDIAPEGKTLKVCSSLC